MTIQRGNANIVLGSLPSSKGPQRHISLIICKIYCSILSVTLKLYLRNTIIFLHRTEEYWYPFVLVLSFRLRVTLSIHDLNVKQPIPIILLMVQDWSQGFVVE